MNFSISSNRPHAHKSNQTPPALSPYFLFLTFPDHFRRMLVQNVVAVKTVNRGFQFFHSVRICVRNFHVGDLHRVIQIRCSLRGVFVSALFEPLPQFRCLADLYRLLLFGGGNFSFYKKMTVGIIADECSAARKQVVDGINHFAFLAVKKKTKSFLCERIYSA